MYANQWLKNKYKVKKILSSDKFIIDFNGISMPVSLTYVKVNDHDKAKKILTDILLDNKITIIPEEEAGLTDTGMQRVYAFGKLNGKKLFIQEKLIKDGAAEYLEGKSKSYKKLLSILKKAQGGAKSSSTTKTSSSSKNQSFCSELYSKKYHTLHCKWAKNMNPKSRIIYDSMASAEKASKGPCNSCLFERVGELRKLKYASKKTSTKSTSSSKKTASSKSTSSTKRTSSSKTSSKSTSSLIGSLFGIKGSEYFYSPISKKISKAKGSELVVYSTVADAKKAGKKPDPRSLRIDNPVMPKPKGKECIGRALPYLRPCRRETDHSTGLCKPCLNGKMR